MNAAQFGACYMEYKTQPIYEHIDPKNQPTFDFSLPVATCDIQYMAEFNSDFFGNPLNIKNCPDFSKHHWDLYLECTAKLGTENNNKKAKPFPLYYEEKNIFHIPKILYQGNDKNYYEKNFLVMISYNIKCCDIFLRDAEFFDTSDSDYIARVRVDLTISRLIVSTKFYLHETKFANFFDTGISTISQLIKFFHPPPGDSAFSICAKPWENINLSEELEKC